MPPLHLSRATEADIPALLDPLYAAFAENDIGTMFFGHGTPADRTSASARIAGSMRETQNVWLKVVEEGTGRVVGGSWWVIYPSWVESPAFTEAAAVAATETPYLEAADRVRGEAMLKDWMARRARHMWSHPHVLLALLFTHPSAQRRGAGTQQVRWGTGVADALGVPWWVEGTVAGKPLYAANGAEVVEEVKREFWGEGGEACGGVAWVSEYTVMRREPKGKIDG